MTIPNLKSQNLILFEAIAGSKSFGLDTDLCFSIGTYLTGDCGGNIYLILNGDNNGFITTDFGHEEFSNNEVTFNFSNLESDNLWFCLEQYKDLIAEKV